VRKGTRSTERNGGFFLLLLRCMRALLPGLLPLVVIGSVPTANAGQSVPLPTRHRRARRRPARRRTAAAARVSAGGRRPSPRRGPALAAAVPGRTGPGGTDPLWRPPRLGGGRLLRPGGGNRLLPRRRGPLGADRRHFGSSKSLASI